MDRVPNSQTSWELQAGIHGVPSSQMFSSCPSLPSGSEFLMRHYLPLRILLVDEKSFNPKQRQAFRNRFFPADIRKKVSAVFRENRSIPAISKFLTSSDKISRYWSAERCAGVGMFGIGLEQLHQITARRNSSTLPPGDDHEDDSDQTILGWDETVEQSTSPTSLVQGLSQLTIGAPRSVPVTPSKTLTPLKHRKALRRAIPPRFGYQEDSEDDESGDMGSPRTEISSMPGTDEHIALRESEKTVIAIVDKQSVKKCLGCLLMALSNAMGHYGRIAWDRTAFVVPKDKTRYYYMACVDGLIMTADRASIMTFMDTKPSLRSTNESVLRQIGAQMVAFIITNDHALKKDRYALLITIFQLTV